jgi:hypothetical protein
MPRGYAPLMTLATVPAVTLLCFVLGAVAVAYAAVRRWRGGGLAASREDPATGALWALAIAVQYGAWLRDTTPIFGGTKHWMTAYPFLALFAGVGVSFAVRLARVRWWGGSLSPLARTPALEIAFAAATLLVPAVQAAHAHPWALSQYNVLVGGAGGGATLGLNRGFWGYQTGAIARHLDEVVPKNGRVYPHDTALPAWDMLQRDGRLRRDIRAVWTPAAADLAIYHHEKHMLGVEYQHWIVFESLAPDHVAGLDGVPVVWTYHRAR